MSSIDHLHSETEMLHVEDHLNLLSAQYMVKCLDTENVCHHHITKKTLKQTDSSCCPDSGMDPQDVHHLFDCTAHPNDL